MTENLRLKAAMRFSHIDLVTDTELAEITELASSICNTPFAFITLLDKNYLRLDIKGKHSDNIALSLAGLCLIAAEEDDVMIIQNLQQHPRLTGNPLVNEKEGMIFYAGTSLKSRDGYKIGTFCVLNTVEQQLNEHQQHIIKLLATQVTRILEFRIANELLELKQAELKKQSDMVTDASTRLRSFFESSRNFHVLLSQKGEVIDFNKTAYNFINRFYDKELKRNDSFIQYIRPEFLSTYVRKYNQALQGKNSIEKGSTTYEGMGEIFWEASFEAAYDFENNIVGVSYIIRDITEQELKEKKIIDQNLSLQKIAHIQAHEFRGPLATLMGLIYLIKTDDDETVYNYLPMLDEAVTKLDTTIRTIVQDTQVGT